jgi:tetratricopeptide (TPR) repeat protein
MAAGHRDEYHPSPDELERLLLGEVSPGEAAPFLAHLLRGCERCQARMEPLVSVMFGAGRSAPEPPQHAGSEYDFPLFKALATARRYAASEVQAKARPRSKSAVPALQAAAPLGASDFAVSQQSREEQDWQRCQKLIEMCRALRNGDPEALLLSASAAVAMSGRLDPSLHGAAALADLQAYALAELGNARRVTDDLVSAEAELARGLERAAQGTGSALLLAHLMDLTASLYIDQSRFEDARRLLDAALVIHQRKGDRHSTGRALISKGFSAVNSLEYEEGIRLLSQGLGMVDAARDSRLVMSGILNLIWSLVECGRAAQAEPLFRQSRQLFAACIERKDGIKITWLEGRIAAALKDKERAEQRLCEARAAFEEVRLPGYVALVSLDLAGLWLRAGRTSEIMVLIEETIAIFRTQGMSREAITTLLILHEAFKKQQATEALLHATAVELSRINEPSNRRDRVLG